LVVSARLAVVVLCAVRFAGLFGCLLVCRLVARAPLRFSAGCACWFRVAASLVGACGAWPAEAFDLGFAVSRGKGFVELVQRSSLNRFSGRFSLSQLSEPC
jgi:hypothetical protein